MKTFRTFTQLFGEHRRVFFQSGESPSQHAEKNPNDILAENVAELIKKGDLDAAQRLIANAANIKEATSKSGTERSNEKPNRSPGFQRKLLLVAMELEKQLKAHKYLSKLGTWEVRPITGGNVLQFACKSAEDGKIRWTALRCLEQQDTDSISFGREGPMGIRSIQFSADHGVERIIQAMGEMDFFPKNGINFGRDDLGSLQPSVWSRRSPGDGGGRHAVYVGDYVQSDNGLVGEIADDPGFTNTMKKE